MNLFGFDDDLNLDDTVIIIQTPKCHTKNGIHTTIKQIYCDLLMNKNHEEFITWLRKLQEKVRELVLANADNWFHEPVTLDEIDHNWNNSIRIYKQTNYLVRTFSGTSYYIFFRKSPQALNQDQLFI